jgi:hypothetical protein
MRWKLFLAIVIALIVLQFLFYFRGIYLPPPTERYALENVTVPRVAPVRFYDEYEANKGVVVFDLAHNNSFSPAELSGLLTRLTSRGFAYEFVENNLGDSLRYASSLVVISPQKFSKEEVSEVKAFIGKGGRLLLVSEPTRRDEINGLSSEFGIVYEEGYLYNMRENDGNFRNIFLKQFAESEVTEGLQKIAFYTSCPITSEGKIILGDENTFSSRKEAPQQFSPAVLKDNILAICDLTFMTDPYNTLLDNPQLVSNIADFLTKAERTFDLEDFPYFLGEEVGVTYTDAALLDHGIKVKKILARKATLGTEEDPSKDTVILGLYDDYVKVSKYLDKENISIIGGKVKVEKIGELGKEGTSLIYLYREGGREVVIILSNDEDGLKETINMLENGRFREHVLTDRLAIITFSEGEET